MSLKKAIEKATQQAFSAAGDTKTRATYLRIGTPTFDADTLETTQPQTGKVQLDVIVANYLQREIDNVNVMPLDKKVIIKTGDLPFEPETQHKIKLPEGTYEVVWFKTDPARARHVLQVRR